MFESLTEKKTPQELWARIDADSCANCRYFTHSGHCNRLPPALQPRGRGFIVGPPVVARNYWCGEHRYQDDV